MAEGPATLAYAATECREGKDGVFGRNPFGTNREGGQIFTMRPDGSGLRQLTFTRGMMTDAEGTVHVELPGPWTVPTRGF